MNICPDISNPEVKREFDNLKLFTKNPYQLWDLNGGYELSKAPNGKNSKFYESLAFRYGDPVKALKQKAYYLTNKDSLNFPLDENGDPLYSSWYARLVNTTPETTKVISDVLPLKGNENQYSEAGLLNDKGKLKQYKSSAQANRIATKLNNAYKINTKSANDRFLVKPVPNGFRVFIKGSIEERVPETSKPVDRYNPLDNFYMGDEQLREQEDKQDSIFYQNNTGQPLEEFVASEKTIRDLTARMSNSDLFQNVDSSSPFEKLTYSEQQKLTKRIKEISEKQGDRIGIRNYDVYDSLIKNSRHKEAKEYKENSLYLYKIINNKDEEYKGVTRVSDGIIYINLAYATLDTPIHEILGHPIIRALKTGTAQNKQLYQNLLKELEYGKGKEVLDRVKRDYQYKNEIPYMSSITKDATLYYDKDTKTGYIHDNSNPHERKTFNSEEEVRNYLNLNDKYTLEEQQEEAIVELLGLYTADRLDKVKDGKLISLLKRLLKEMKQFVRSLINQKEVEIDKLPDNMTLGDIADLLAYSNSKLILPGNEVVYTTPDNQQFKTYAEASNHISELAKSVEDVDLNNVKINTSMPDSFELEVDMGGDEPANLLKFTKEDGQWYISDIWTGKNKIEESEVIKYYQDKTGTYFGARQDNINNFIEKNKQYEQSKEIIEEWKKVNNIKYDPEEVYSRGQGFYSVVGAYSDFDVELMFQNLLAHIEDNKKAGGEFTISAFTKPIDILIPHLEGGGGKIKFKIFPKSNDIKWAANTDVSSGSVWDASKKVSKDTKSEIIGVSYTKSPALNNINSVQPNLASIIDNLEYHHNELGIELTGNNFRLEYDDNVLYSTKKLINKINGILDSKFGKLVEPEITNSPKQPTQTNETLKESIESVESKLGIVSNLNQYGEDKMLDKVVEIPKKLFPLAEVGDVIERHGGRYRVIEEYVDVDTFNNSTKKMYRVEYIKPTEKEYTSQALINTKIAKLKEVAKKYHRSLIRSEVRKISVIEKETGMRYEDTLFEPDELPFQKVSEKSNLYRLPVDKFEAPLKSLDRKLINLLEFLNIKTIDTYETLKEELGIDALGFTELAFGTAEIKVRKFRDRMTLPEEASHVFVAMLNADYKKRLFTELKKSNYYKTILSEEYESYKEKYKNDEDALIFEAAGKLLAQVFINKELGIEQLPPTTRNLLQRIWDYLRTLVKNFPIHLIEKELNILTEEISDRFLNNDITDIASIKNITPVGKNKDITKVLRTTRSKIKSEKELLEKTLISSTKRLNYYKSQLDSAKASKNKEQIERLQRLTTKNEELQKNIHDSIQNKTYLDGITEYLKGLNEEHESYIKAVESISKQLNKFEMKDMGVISSRLKTMKYTIDTNRGTLKALSLNLNELFSEEKELAKTLSKQADDLYVLFEKLDNNYIDLGSIIVSEVFKTFLGDRNNQDIIDDINRNRVEKDKISILDLKQTLESTEGDINFITRWLDALADTPDDICKIIDVVVKEAKTSARLQAIDDQKDLLTEEEKITKAGLRSEFVAETHKGKVTGDFVVENDWTSFRLAEKEFYKKLKDEYGVDNSNEIKDKKILETYNKKISKFYSEYTLSTYQPIVNGEVFMSEAEKFIEQKKKELSSKEFTIWEHFNVEYRANGSPIVLKNKSEQYKEIQSDPTKKAYYDAILNLKYELDMLLPPKMRHPRRLPQIKKDFVERFITFSRRRQKEDLQTLFGEFKDMFVITEDQDDRGVKFSLTNDGENEVKFLPIYYVNKLQDPNTLSLDVTSTMSIFSAMARDFGEMNKIKDLLEIAKDVINEREICEVDEDGNPIIESIKVFGKKLTRNLKKPGEKSMIAARLQDYYDMVIYGETTKDLGKIKGTKIDTAKVIQNYLMYSSMNSLSLNLFAGTANIINGVVNTHIDSQAAQYVPNSSLVYADKILAKDLPQLLSGIGAVDERGRLNKKYAKSNLFFQINDTFQDHNPATKALHAGRKNFFIRLFNSSSLFVINRGGEYWLQGRMSLALANEYRYKDGKFVWKSEFYKELQKVEFGRKDAISSMLTYPEINSLKKELKQKGISQQRREEIKQRIKQVTPTNQAIKAEIKKINEEYANKSKELKTKLDAEWGGMTNYYEAHEVIGNKIKLKKGFKDNLKDRTRFTNRTNSINKSLHGIYNDIDKSAAQQNMWFNIVNQFRKWMIPFWNRRYQKLQYNYERDAWTEGYYVSAFNFIKNLISDYKAGEVSLRKNWNTLSDLEKANFKRAMVEMSYVIGFIGLAAITSSLDWDDEDMPWILQLIVYLINRMITEIGAMTPTPLMITEGFRIIQRPIPGSSHIQNIFTLMTPWQWFDEIERGRFEGMNHLERAVIKGTPVVSQVTTWNSIEEKMVFFNR